MPRKDDIICRCEEISRGEITDAIHAGDRSPDSIKRRTRAGMGFCQGKTCSRLVAQMLATETGIPIAEIRLPSKRPPVGSIGLEALAHEQRNVDDDGKT